jgi:hypothetical protein
MSFLDSTLRSRFFAALAGSLCLAIGGAASAQVVEDKAPQPAAPKSASDTPAASDNSGATSEKPVKPADPSKVSTDTKVNADAPKASTNAKVDADVNASGNAAGADAKVNANTRTNTAQPGTTNQGNRTFSNDPAAAAAGRVKAGINAGANAANSAANTAVNGATNVNANADFGRVATQLGLNFAAGAANALTLSTVGQNSVFANAGFLPNDQFVSIGGTPIANQAAFYRYLSTVPAGQRVPIIVMRNGRQQTLYWTPDQRFVQLQPMFREVAVVDIQPAVGHNSLGITLDENVTDAVIVADVAAGSPASNAGVRRGDQIVALNDQEVQSPAQFHEAAAQMPANSPARIAVARTVELQLSGVQQTGAVVPATGRAVVQPAAPVGVVQPARPIAPVRRFRFR